MENREMVLATLDRLGIVYELTEHPAAYTIEDMEQFGVTHQGMVCKNLFLRDFKGKRHFLVIMPGNKRADLKRIAEQIGSSALSFASEKRLADVLGLTAGAVTPLGVINDREHKAEVVMDRDLAGAKRLGVHPNVNTATVWMSFDGLLAYVSHFGGKVTYISV